MYAIHNYDDLMGIVERNDYTSYCLSDIVVKLDRVIASIEDDISLGAKSTDLEDVRSLLISIRKDIKDL